MPSPMIGPICRDLDKAIAELRAHDPNDPRIADLENLKDQYGCSAAGVIEGLPSPTDADIVNYTNLRDRVSELADARNDIGSAMEAADAVVDAARKFTDS